MITTTTNSRTRLRTGSALRALALTGAGLMIGFAAPAFAQDTTAQTNATPTADQNAPAQDNQDNSAQSSQDIVVTGTLFRNASAATASPVTTLTSEDLANRGVTSVADAVQTLSANNAGTAAPSWSTFGFATGASAPSLRGLNDAYTLTIFDGLRSAVYPLADDGSRNFVDINSIPDSIVDRVQVLQDGASATYGADAIAGVVNVIIKKEITGLHLNASSGISQRGDDGEQRLDATLGYGKLDEQGWNFWVNGEYQKNDTLYMRDRGYPYNTADLSKICGSSLGVKDSSGNYEISPGQTTCMNNGIANGVQADGSFGGLASTKIPFVRAYDAATGSYVGNWQFLNPAAGCGTLTSLNLSPSQVAGAPAGTPSTVCQEDFLKEYQQYQPSIERLGGNARFTANIGSRAQAYVMFNYYRVKTHNTSTPLSYAGQTAAGGTVAYLNPLYLPVYVCPERVNCDTAADRTLNTTNNPFAAQGYEARLTARFPEPRVTNTNAQTFRVTAGIDGSFGKDWNYNVDYTASRVNLDVDQLGFINARRLLNVINDGTYNFADQSANSQAMLDYVAPPSHNHSVSILQQVQATLSKDLFQLPGGPLQLAVGGAYRYEQIDNPSANPANEVDPYDRYYSINAVGVEGKRNVKSAFFELDAPIIEALDLKASGRYDKYSSGQTNFSPKFEAKFKPTSWFEVRGTYSKGFRIPSFNEAYGLPTTGYVTTSVTADTDYGRAFLAAHSPDGNYLHADTYASAPYSYGLTAVGNPNLKPEKSTSYTAGIVLSPTPRLTFTADYWNIKIKDLITAPDYSGVLAQYYSNNGVVNVPGITVTKAVPDPDYPTALPLIQTIEYSFTNADSSNASGVDFTATGRFPIGDHVRWTSTVNASRLIKLGQTISGVYQQYEGTLSPCNITSCSGAPKWRGSWQNTLDFGSTSLTATIYYTSGYDLESTDYGGIPGDCLGSLGASIVTYSDGVTPVLCRAKSFMYMDLHASQKVADHFTLYADVLNVTGAKAPFDPSAAYSLYQFNPSWADAGFIGRYFRVGAKVDF